MGCTQKILFLAYAAVLLLNKQSVAAPTSYEAGNPVVYPTNGNAYKEDTHSGPLETKPESFVPNGLSTNNEKLFNVNTDIPKSLQANGPVPHNVASNLGPRGKDNMNSIEGLNNDKSPIKSSLSASPVYQLNKTNLDDGVNAVSREPLGGYNKDAQGVLSPTKHPVSGALPPTQSGINNNASMSAKEGVLAIKKQTSTAPGPSAGNGSVPQSAFIGKESLQNDTSNSQESDKIDEVRLVNDSTQVRNVTNKTGREDLKEDNLDKKLHNPNNSKSDGNVSNSTVHDGAGLDDVKLVNGSTQDQSHTNITGRKDLKENDLDKMLSNPNISTSDRNVSDIPVHDGEGVDGVKVVNDSTQDQNVTNLTGREDFEENDSDKMLGNPNKSMSIGNVSDSTLHDGEGLQLDGETILASSNRSENDSNGQEHKHLSGTPPAAVGGNTYSGMPVAGAAGSELERVPTVEGDVDKTLVLPTARGSGNNLSGPLPSRGQGYTEPASSSNEGQGNGVQGSESVGGRGGEWSNLSGSLHSRNDLASSADSGVQGNGAPGSLTVEGRDRVTGSLLTGGSVINNTEVSVPLEEERNKFTESPSIEEEQNNLPESAGREGKNNLSLSVPVDEQKNKYTGSSSVGGEGSLPTGDEGNQFQGQLSPGGQGNANPGSLPVGGQGNANPGSVPTGGQGNANPGSLPTGGQGNANPGSLPTGGQGYANPGSVPTGGQRYANPGSLTGGQGYANPGSVPTGGQGNANPGSLPTGGQGNANPGSLPTGGQGYANPGSVPTGGQGNANPGSLPTGGQGNANPGSLPTGGQGYANPGSVPTGGQGNANPGSLPTGGQGNANPGSLPTRGQGYANPGSQPAGGQGNAIPGSQPAGGQGNAIPGSQPAGGQGNANLGSLPVRGQGNANPGSQLTGGQGNANPGSQPAGGQGNANPGSLPTGEEGNANPGSLPTGEEGNANPGSLPTGEEGNANPGSLPTGEEGNANPGSLPTGEEGNANPGSLPTGEEGNANPGSLPTGEEGNANPGSLPTGVEGINSQEQLAVGEEKSNLSGQPPVVDEGSNLPTPGSLPAGGEENNLPGVQTTEEEYPDYTSERPEDEYPDYSPKQLPVGGGDNWLQELPFQQGTGYSDQQAPSNKDEVAVPKENSWEQSLTNNVGDRQFEDNDFHYNEEEESPGSGHFFGFLLTGAVLCISGYVIYHNKQKIKAFCIEGRSAPNGRRRGGDGVKYTQLKSNMEEVMPSLEKTTTAKNYVY